MTKIPKKAQVAFNQFIFDTMMQKIREVELLEKKITEHENLLKVHVQKIGNLERKTTHEPLDRAVLMQHSDRIAQLEHEIKDQREDYHAHIRQLVEENEAAHMKFEKYFHDQRIINTGLQNEVLKLRDEKKKKSGRPKKQ